MDLATTSTAVPNQIILDQAVSELHSAKDTWARTSTSERVQILLEIKDALMNIAEGWATTAARHKLLQENSPLVGEEWASGPYPVMAACNTLIATLSKMEGKRFLDDIPLRELANGQTCATVLPNTAWDRLVFSGVTAEVWMQEGVTTSNLADSTAIAYDIPVEARIGKVSLILGAGNIAAIPPLDCFQKLFSENQVVMLKMNPVNDYLIDFFQVALKPLIKRNALRIVSGDLDVGEYLCTHPDIEEIHITGAKSSHDAIIWGSGDEGNRNKAAGTPRNTRRMTSELGGVSPTIVVPGPWNKADLRFQAEHIATQKLHNSGFNCVASQMLIMPKGWDKSAELINELTTVISSAPSRPLYYPGASERMKKFKAKANNAEEIQRCSDEPVVVVPITEENHIWFESNEAFSPVLGIYELEGSIDPTDYLLKAIKYANDNLEGTLGANIVVHPSTIEEIGQKKLEELIAELRYGCIAVNAWTGLGFLAVQTPWGGFAGHTLEDVGSGIGAVHNTFMFEKTERTVITAPFRPFPRSVLGGSLTILPKPPWFITNKRSRQLGEALTRFQHNPKWPNIVGIFIDALRG